MKRLIIFIICTSIVLLMSSCTGSKSTQTTNNQLESTVDKQTAINNSTASVGQDTKDNSSSMNIAGNTDVGIDENLCGKGEKVVFGFKLKKSNKRVSICTSEEKDYIVYRFGTKDRVELEFPKEKENSWDKFAYSYYLRGGGKENIGLDLNHIIFENGDFSYDIYQDYSAEDGVTSVGIIVKNTKSKEETRIDGSFESLIGTLIDFRRDSRVKQIDSWF